MIIAKISEIFMSYQGEGPFVGSKQLFVRFYGCNRSCRYCDTKLESYRSFTKDSLMGQILGFDESYNELTMTGGEPLLYPVFLRAFLELFRTHRKTPVYLETNGTLADALEEVLDRVDIISMDFKLPSSTGDTDKEVWAAHEKFAKIASKKKLVIKAVITDETVMNDIKQMGRVILELGAAPDVVLQPVTPINASVKAPDAELLEFFQKYLEKLTGRDIMVRGQIHKCLGIR